ncbi:MAG: flagellar brake protein [Phycisphaerae bacterium]
MNALNTVLPRRDLEALANAIRRRFRAIVTLNLPGGWRTHKGVFVDAGDAHSVVVHVSSEQDNRWASDDRRSRTVGVTFRVGRQKCMFASRLRSSASDADGVLLTLDWPTELVFLQRRAYERVNPPEGHVVTVRFWRQQDAHDPGGRENMRYGQLENISAGGMRVKTRDHAEIELDQTYRCSFCPFETGTSLVIDAHLRHRESAEGERASLGFQFVGLEATEPGRKTLAQLAAVVADYQRTHRKKHRSRVQ